MPMIIVVTTTGIMVIMMIAILSPAHGCEDLIRKVSNDL